MYFLPSCLLAQVCLVLLCHKTLYLLYFNMVCVSGLWGFLEAFFFGNIFKWKFSSFSASCVILRHISRSAVGWGATRAAMLTLASKLKREDAGKTGRATGAPESTHRVSIRDRLLTKGTALATEKKIDYFGETKLEGSGLFLFLL